MYAFSANSFIVSMMGFAVLYMSFISTLPCPCLVLFGGMPGPAASSITWTAGNIRKLAKDRRMLDAVNMLVNNRAPELPQLKKAIDAATDGDLRRVIFHQLGRRHTQKDRLYMFAATDDGSATCSAGTAGAVGLEDCASTCAARDVYAASCYTLCSLAVSPCGGRPSSVASTSIALATGAQRVRTLVECALEQLPRLAIAMNAAYDFLHELVVLEVVALARLAMYVCCLPVWGVLYNGVTEIMMAYSKVAFCLTVMTFTMFCCWKLFKLHARRPTLALGVRRDAGDYPRARASSLPARIEPLHAEAWRPRASSVG